MMRSFAHWSVTLLIIGVMQSITIPQATAQSVPSGCRPAGNTYECTTIEIGPYVYTHNTGLT